MNQIIPLKVFGITFVSGKYHFLTPHRQFSQNHGFVAILGDINIMKIYLLARKKRDLCLIERKEVELRNFWCVISGIKAPQKAAETKKYTFIYCAPPYNPTSKRTSFNCLMHI